MTKVLIQTDDEGRITAIGSSVFLGPAPEGWLQLAEGDGDRFVHAQNQFLPHPLRDSRGVCRFRLEDGQAVLRSEADMDRDAAASPAPPTTEERLRQMEAAGLERDMALMELAAELTALMEGDMN